MIPIILGIGMHIAVEQTVYVKILKIANIIVLYFNSNLFLLCRYVMYVRVKPAVICLMSVKNLILRE